MSEQQNCLHLSMLRVDFSGTYFVSKMFWHPNKMTVDWNPSWSLEKVTEFQKYDR